MADPKTQFLTNDNLTRKKWARDLFKVLLTDVEFNSLIGRDKNAVVMEDMDLAKGEGDQMTFGIRLPLTGEGVVGDATVEGNEEKMRFRNFKATIEELNHAVDTGGKMEQQRVPYDLMSEGKEGLQEWWGQKLSEYMFAVLCGNTAYTIASQTFADAPDSPASSRSIVMNSGTAGSLTAADEADLHFLDRMKQKAEYPDADNSANTYKLRPAMKKDGKNYFRVIMHTYAFDRLRQNLNAGQWGDLLRNAQKLGMPQVEFEYNGLLVSKSERIYKSTAASSGDGGEYRNILLGAQAAVMGWGGAGDSKSTVMSFVPYTRDAERYVMIRGGGILGIRRVLFDSVDFGVVFGTSYATPLD
jgi:N4-gp56 family major capsid protein